MHPNREWVATGQLGRRPFVCVWDAITCQQLQRIVHPAGMRGIIALTFSQSDGAFLFISVWEISLMTSCFVQQAAIISSRSTRTTRTP